MSRREERVFNTDEQERGGMCTTVSRRDVCTTVSRRDVCTTLIGRGMCTTLIGRGMCTTVKNSEIRPVNPPQRGGLHKEEDNLHHPFHCWR